MFAHLNSYILLACLLHLFVTGCSNQVWHESLRSAQTIHCNKDPLPEYDDCVKQSGEGYKDYEKKRESIITDK